MHVFALILGVAAVFALPAAASTDDEPSPCGVYQWSPLLPTPPIVPHQMVRRGSGADAEIFIARGRGEPFAPQPVWRLSDGVWSPAGKLTVQGAFYQMCVVPRRDGSPDDVFICGNLGLGDPPIGYPAARWNGADWEPVGDLFEPFSGVSPTATAIAAVDLDGPGGEPPRLWAYIFLATVEEKVYSLVDDVWQVEFTPGLSSSATLISAFDPDGSGPTPTNVLIARDGVSSECLPVSGQISVSLGRWDGTTFDPCFLIVTPALSGVIRAVSVLKQADGDRLFVGGSFDTAFLDGRDVECKGIIEWTGQQWLPLGFGVEGDVNTIADVSGDEEVRILAGGYFTGAGRTSAKMAAIWNGVGWEATGADMNDAILCSAVDHSSGLAKVHVGGKFLVAGGQSSKRMAVYSAPDGPILLGQPQSIAIATGGVASFSVGGTGTGSMYFQWRKDGEALVDNFAVSGATTPEVVLDPAYSAASGTYDCLVTDDCGEAISNAAVLTILCDSPQIIDPPSDASALSGGTVMLSVAALGSPPLSYQWSRNDVAIVDSREVLGATTAVLQLLDVDVADAGSYRVCVTNDCGTVQTDAVMLTVALLGDLNQDGSVDGSDLGILLGFWGSCGAGCPADLNGDGVVDGGDAGLLLSNWSGA